MDFISLYDQSTITKKALKKFFEDNSLVNKVLSIIENFLKYTLKIK